MRKYQSFALSVLVISILFAFIYEYPRYKVGSELRAFQSKLAILYAKKAETTTILPIMSYNLRFECSERDPDNNWTNRISRVRNIIQQYSPWVIGTQELMYSQAMQLQKTLSPIRYKMVGQQGSKSQYTGTAIFYNANYLELIESDLIWLSLTPQIENSKSWDSNQPRMLTIARFRIRDKSSEIGEKKAQELIVFNAHLDHLGGDARINQARIIKEMITAKREQFPDLPIVLTGDFNTVPGQAAYQVLIDHNNSDKKSLLLDSFRQAEGGEYSGIASSFHFWFGARANAYLARILLYPIFVAHAVYCQKNLESIFPAQWDRFHIDWILYSPSEEVQVIPRFASIVDVTYSQYSSDHFPIITLFELNNKRD